MVDCFDITCTATLRPELLKVTLDSHIKYLFKKDAVKGRLIINVDVTGTKTTCKDEQVYLLQKIEEIVHETPFYEKVIRVSYIPNFPDAFNWCMRQTKTRMVFNLEEDWEMLLPIDFEKMWEVFKEQKNLVHLRLSAFRSEENTLKNWNRFLRWNGKYYEVSEEERGIIGWAGHPSLNRTNFMYGCLVLIDNKLNPEKQIKSRRYPHSMNHFLQEHRFGSFHLRSSPPAIKDIGRQWMILNGWEKAGNKAFFTHWQRKKGNK